MWGLGNNVALFSKNRNECQMHATMVILKKLDKIEDNYAKEGRPDSEKKITFSITYICMCVYIH